MNEADVIASQNFNLMMRDKNNSFIFCLKK
jgi:hypothetical protein